MSIILILFISLQLVVVLKMVIAILLLNGVLMDTASLELALTTANVQLKHSVLVEHVEVVVSIFTTLESMKYAFLLIHIHNYKYWLDRNNSYKKVFVILKETLLTYVWI